MDRSCLRIEIRIGKADSIRVLPNNIATARTFLDARFGLKPTLWAFRETTDV